MSKKSDLGKFGERMAAEYLLHKGYRILETNWRFGRTEIDIIAMDRSVVVFVEVKTRSGDRHGPPDLAITPAKEGRITGTAQAYLSEKNHEGAVRFDVVSVTAEKDAVLKIEHIEDAFFWGL